MRPNEKEFIYTDDVDYAETSDVSVWGSEERTTLNLLRTLKISGTWLNLCAGDGRFSTELLQRTQEVICADIDESALQKIVRITPKQLRSRLRTQRMNIVEPFPFVDESFDGVFCVGTLHLFPKPIFKKIVREINRVLKSGGNIILDFATDIKRTYPDTSLWIVENEPNYTLNAALTFLKKMFAKYETNFITDTVEPEDVTLNDRTYTFTCNFILLCAKKF